MPSKSLLGEWEGGLWSDGTFKLAATGNGFVKGEFKSADGSETATIQGQLQDENKVLKGLYTLSGGSASDAAGFELVLSSDGLTAEGKALAAGGAAQQLHGRKVFKGARLPDGRLNPEGAYKNKDVFKRLCSSAVDKAELREQVLSESIQRTAEPNGDPFGDAFVSVAVGDEYDDTVIRRHQKHSRHGGKQFGTGGITRKKQPSDMAAYPHMADPYETSGERMRRLRKEALAASRRRQGVKEKPPAFKPSNAKFQREVDDVFVNTEADKTADKNTLTEMARAAKRRDLDSRAGRLPKNSQGRMEVKIAPRNFLANPPKKGSWGQAGTLMGETLKNTPGVGDEAVKSVFKYEHSDYDGPRLAAKADREAARQRLAGKKPFVGHVSRALHRKELPIVEDVYLAGELVDNERLQGRAFLPEVVPAATARQDRESLAMQPEPRRPRTQQETRRAARQAAQTEALRTRPPFRSSSAFNKGALGGYPKHVPDPLPPKVYRARGAGHKAFVPPRVARSRMTRSVMLGGPDVVFEAKKRPPAPLQGGRPNTSPARGSYAALGAVSPVTYFKTAYQAAGTVPNDAVKQASMVRKSHIEARTAALRATTSAKGANTLQWNPAAHKISSAFI